MRPVLKQPEIRRDAVRVLRAAFADPDLMVKVADQLPGFDRPALVVWASRDRVMPLEHGRRLAELLPYAQLVEVDDTYTLIPLDQPAKLAQAFREFTRASDTARLSHPQLAGPTADADRQLLGRPALDIAVRAADNAAFYWN
jgi:hypothetical protein